MFSDGDEDVPPPALLRTPSTCLASRFEELSTEAPRVDPPMIGREMYRSGNLQRPQFLIREDTVETVDYDLDQSYHEEDLVSFPSRINSTGSRSTTPLFPSPVNDENSMLSPSGNSRQARSEGCLTSKPNGRRHSNTPYDNCSPKSGGSPSTPRGKIVRKRRARLASCNNDLQTPFKAMSEVMRQQEDRNRPMSVQPPLQMDDMDISEVFLENDRPSRFTAIPRASSRCYLDNSARFRSQSMTCFEDVPKPVFASDKAPQPVPVIKHSKPSVLPTIDERHHLSEAIPLITPDTLCDVIDGKYSDQFTQYVIIDARFPFEYNGGHIVGAMNMWTRERLMDAFLSHPIVDYREGAKICIIFHCEFSSVRGPQQHLYLRELDHTITLNLPELIYPEMYVLKGGYEKFYEAHPQRCTPHAYVPMKHVAHKQEYEQSEAILSRSRSEAKYKKWEDHCTVLNMCQVVRHCQTNLRQALEIMYEKSTRMEVSLSPRTPKAQILI